MSLIYITGPSGSGKSTVREELVKRGYEAHDTDEVINDWINKETGQIVQYTKESAASSSRWVAEHDFLMSEQKIKDLAEKAKDRTIFICGLASNDVDFMRYFDKVICLLISAEIMQQRVTSRQNNKWGHNPEQLEIMKKWYQPTVDRYRNLGATMVNASQPLDKVIEEILRVVK